MVSEFAILAQKWSKLQCQKSWFLVFANHPGVHSGGISKVRVCGCGCWRYWHLTGDSWHATCDTSHITHFFKFMLLYAHVERFSVSHIQDFFLLYIKNFNSQLLKVWFVKKKWISTQTNTSKQMANTLSLW